MNLKQEIGKRITNCKNREFVKSIMPKEFHKYIDEKLAGDFSYHLEKAWNTRPTEPQQVNQGEWVSFQDSAPPEDERLFIWEKSKQNISYGRLLKDVLYRNAITSMPTVTYFSHWMKYSEPQPPQELGTEEEG